MYHQWDGKKAAFIKAVVAMATSSSQLTYDGENDVSLLKPSVLFRSSSNTQVTRTVIKSRTISNFGQIGPLDSDLGTLSI